MSISPFCAEWVCKNRRDFQRKIYITCSKAVPMQNCPLGVPLPTVPIGIVLLDELVVKYGQILSDSNFTSIDRVQFSQFFESRFLEKSIRATHVSVAF